MSHPKKSPCRGCGKMLIWGTTRDGKKIPLDPVAPVYAVVALEYPAHSSEEIVRVQRTPTLEIGEGPATHMRHFDGQWLMAAYVSHFATCSKANQFSGRNK